MTRGVDKCIYNKQTQILNRKMPRAFSVWNINNYLDAYFTVQYYIVTYLRLNVRHYWYNI